MFEINTIFLYKFGWVMNHWCKEYRWSFHASDRIYSILYQNDKIYFIKSKGTFDKKDYPTRVSSFYNVSSFLKKEENVESKIEIKSNAEMINHIKKNDACVLEYQRHFKLSSILNK